MNGANLREANLTGSNLKDTQLTNLISIEGADFTDASALSKESASYLISIASGSHPVTARQTAQTLKDFQDRVIRQWVDGKRISREQRELTERIERNNDASKLE